ncbi:MAG: YCF48-related protein [Pseudomonadota bacterium]
MRHLYLAALAAACLGSAGARAAGVAERVVDPLGRPAPASVHFQQAMLSAVTRAGERLVAVGERGTVLLSDDGGRNWRQARRVPVSVLLTAVRFGSAAKGWAVGHSGVVLRSNDGGETWSTQLDGNAAAALVLKAAQQRAQAGNGDAAALAKQVADAQQLVRDGADKPFLDVLADGESGAIVVGAFGLAMRTDDAGKTWRPWQTEVLGARGSHLYGIAKAGNTIFVAGEQGAFFKSGDNGATLAELATPYKGSYFGLTALSASNVVVYGLRGSVFASGDAGANWRPAQLASPASLTAGALLADGSLVLASQAGTLFTSRDQGLSFAAMQQSSPAPIVGIAQARDGGVVIAGARGPARIAAHPSSNKTGAP